MAGFTIVNGFHRDSWEVAASQTIAKGDPLILSSGKLAIATTSSAKIFAIADEAITTGSASSGEYIDIGVIMEDTILEGTASGTLALTDAMLTAASSFDLAGSTGSWTVNISASTYDIFQFIGIKDGWEKGTLGTLGYFKVNNRIAV